MNKEITDILYTLALTRINYFHLAGLRQLYMQLGSATAIFENRNNIRDIIPDASPKLIHGLQNIDEPLKRAEAELEYDLAHDILPIPLNDANYPQRLKECDDAPLLLFYKGNANLNQQRVINIVGTRHCTIYGQELVRQFVADLRQLCPHVLVVSGMAYGVDINARSKTDTRPWPYLLMDSTISIRHATSRPLMPCSIKGACSQNSSHRPMPTR